MRIYLAPMEGVIDHHLRHLLTNVGGICLCTTEFVRVTEHTLPGKVFLKYCPELLLNSPELLSNNPELLSNNPELLSNSPELLANSPELLSNSPELLSNSPELLANSPELKLNSPPSYGAHCPVRVQLLGNNPQSLAINAAKAASMGAPGIDLNFGCPAKTVNRHRGGACLLDHTELLKEIVTQVRAAVPPHIPVSVKIRLGYENRDSGLRNAIAIQEAGANELAVHARSKADGYKPPAYWREISAIKQALDIPVIANGEIWTVEDFLRCVEQSQCEHIMLGRGLLARPDLALQIRAHINSEDFTPYEWQQVAAVLLEFFLLTKNQYQKRYMGNRIKQWLFYLKMTYPEAQTLFEEIKRERDEDILEECLARQQAF